MYGRNGVDRNGVATTTWVNSSGTQAGVLCRCLQRGWCAQCGRCAVPGVRLGAQADDCSAGDEPVFSVSGIQCAAAPVSALEISERFLIPGVVFRELKEDTFRAKSE